MAELDAMVRMLYGSPDADPDLMKTLAVNGSGDEDALTFDEFLQVPGGPGFLSRFTRFDTPVLCPISSGTVSFQAI